METQNDNSTDKGMELEQLQQIFAKPETNDVEDFLADEDLERLARYLCVTCLGQDDEQIAVLGHLLSRISDALTAKVRPIDVANQIDYLLLRLYSWSYTGETAASNWRDVSISDLLKKLPL